MDIESSADFVRMTRGALAASGFVRHERGEMVWWESAEPARPEPTPPIVLLHGVNDQAGTWFTIAPALAQRTRVVIPDLPGHGESGPKDGPLLVASMAGRLASILPSDPFVLVGNSLGGWLAILFTLQYPQRVLRLVLEAGGGLNRPFTSPVLATDRESALSILKAVHGPQYVAPEWVIRALLERAADSPLLRVSATEDLFVDARLEEIRVPTDLIWGADDGVLSVDYARELQQGIAGARLHVLEGAAHIPHLQQPRKVLECLTAIC